MQERTWITLGLARAQLGINEATLRHWADDGLVRAFRTPGGHRRFAADDIQALIDSGSKPRGRFRLSDDTTVLPRIRRRVNTTKPRNPGWMNKFSEAAHQQMRELGREFLDLCTSYVDRPSKQTLAIASQLGGAYAKASRENGLVLHEAIEAFIFFREVTVNAIKPTLVRQGSSATDVCTTLEQVSRLTDRVLLGMTSIYGEG